MKFALRLRSPDHLDPSNRPAKPTSLVTPDIDHKSIFGITSRSETILNLSVRRCIGRIRPDQPHLRYSASD